MKTGGTTRIRLKIAAGYLVIAMLVCGIVHVWLGEWREMGPQEEEYRKINRLRTEVHESTYG